MAGEIQLAHSSTAKTLYALVRNTTGSVWRTTTSTFVVYNSSNLANYIISLTEQGTASCYYAATFPAASAGTYNISIYEQAGGSAAEGDNIVGAGGIEWDGSAVVTLTSRMAAASLPTNFSSLSIDSSGRVDIGKTLGTAVTLDANSVLNVSTKYLAGTALTGRDIGSSVLLSSGTGTGQLDFTSGVAKTNITQLLGTTWLTPGTAGTPDVNVKLWNGLTTVALPLIPTTAGRTLDVSATGEAGVDWGNIGSPTTTVALTGTTIATTQKVDIETIKTNAVVNGGTITFPTNSTLASTGNITGGVITTVTNLTNVSSGGIVAASFAADSITASAIAADAIGSSELAASAVTEIQTGLSTLDASGIRTAVGLASANLDTQLSTIAGYIDTEVGAIKTKTDFLPSATAGAAGGLFIAGSNATTTVNITGNLSGSVGSLTTNNDKTGYSLTVTPPTAIQVRQEVDSNSTQLAAIKAKTDAVTITSGRVVSDATAIAGSSTAATNQANAATCIYTGSVTGSSTTTTIVDSGLTSGETDNFKGRIVIFKTGTLQYQGATITAFNPATDTLTVSTLSSAPTNGDVYVIL